MIEIRSRDETAFRVSRVTAAARCATSVMYHHFGSREGLIDAAYVELCRHEWVEYLRLLSVARQNVDHCRDLESFLLDFDRTLRDGSRESSVSMFIRLWGVAQTRPSVNNAMSDGHRHCVEITSLIFDRLRERGLVQRAVESFTLAEWWHSFQFISLGNDQRGGSLIVDTRFNLIELWSTWLSTSND